MNIRAGFQAVPRFWKIYIICMLLAMLRMGDPDWEWPSSGWESWSLAVKSAQQSLVRDVDVISVFPISTFN